MNAFLCRPTARIDWRLVFTWSNPLPLRGDSVVPITFEGA